MQERADPGVCDELVRDYLELIGVEALGVVVWPLSRAAHPLSHPFHFLPNLHKKVAGEEVDR